MFPAYSYLDTRPGLPALFGGDPHKPSYSFPVQNMEGIVLKDAVFYVTGKEFPLGIIP
jgi:hypothetical protein